MRVVLLALALWGCGGVAEVDLVAPDPAEPCDPMAEPAPDDLTICCEADAPICAEWKGPDWSANECVFHALCGGHCEGWYMPEGSPCAGGACDARGACVVACDPAQCPGPPTPTPCLVATCAADGCALAPAPNGTPSGEDGDPCTVDACLDGVPVHEPVPMCAK